MTIPSWAVRGAKVVCVDAFIDAARHHKIIVPLVQNEVYTIREVTPRPDGVGILLDEIVNEKSVVFPDLEYAYRIQRFRPLIALEDDIANHFEIHLRNDHRATRRVGEDA